MTQAKAGGEIGKNGEFYKGGQFLPESAMTIKGAQNQAEYHKTGKQCVAPYMWEEQPAPGMQAIFGRIENSSRVINRDNCEYIKGEGLIGAELEYVPQRPEYPVEYQTREDVPAQYTPYPVDCKTKWLAVDDNGAWVTAPLQINSEREKFFSGLVDKWNAGTRWMEIKDDPYHHLNK